MKILITGIHGFVGGNLVKALGQSNEIYLKRRVWSRPFPGMILTKIRFHK